MQDNPERCDRGNAWKILAMRLLDFIFPPRCPATGDFVDRQGMISPEAWRGLSFIGDSHCVVCGMPFEVSVPDGGLQCVDCLRDPPPFTSARAALAYNDASRALILKFKHGDALFVAHCFTPWLLAAGREMLQPDAVLAPVPLHRWRLLRRRYNQAALLAWGLARETRMRVIPDALLRIRATAPQGHKDRSMRAANVRRAFRVHPGRATEIAGRHVVLIDDVYTTGATVRECARSLLEAGAARVDVLCVARVVPDR